RFPNQRIAIAPPTHVPATLLSSHSATSPKLRLSPRRWNGGIPVGRPELPRADLLKDGQSMRASLRSLVAFAAALSLAGVAAAQVPLRPNSLPGTATVDFTGGPIAGAVPSQPVVTVPVAPATAPSVFMPQPAEHLGQASGTGGPWFVVAPYAW